MDRRSRTVSAALPRLLRAARRRLATAELVRAATFGAWWLGAASLALGVVHRWWAALPAGAVAAVALAPAVLAVLWLTWRRRPTLDAAARYVDRVFDGRELAVAAVEVARLPAEARSATARLVAHRAECAAVDWLPRLPKVRAEGARGTAAALALAAAGSFLLVNPSLAPPSAADVSRGPRDAAASVPAATRIVAPELAAAEERARLMAENETPGAAEPDGHEPVPLLIPQLRAGVAAGNERETGQLPATARAATRPDGRAEPVAMEVRLILSDAVDSASQRAAGAGGVELDGGAAREADLRAAPETRNTAGVITDLNRFTPAERRYLAAYFNTDAEHSRAAAEQQDAP
jgi:hypothetical protein